MAVQQQTWEMEILPSEYYGVIINSNRKVAIAVKEEACGSGSKIDSCHLWNTTFKALDICITSLSHSGGALKYLSVLQFLLVNVQ